MQTSQSCAVKYRPNTLDDLYGIPDTVATIRGLMSRKQFPNALLIYGKSGAGKTTVARIIANTINGIKPNEINPDLLEPNGAEERGIDDIRRFIEIAKYAPRKNLRFILIDEVHGLTPQSMQALLKTVEEPPKRTTWMLCTTEPQELPMTLRSRCVPIKLEYPDKTAIVEMLNKIAKAEKFLHPLEKYQKLLNQIAINTNCQPRESIQWLELAAARIAGGGKAQVESFLQEMAGADNINTAKCVLTCLYVGVRALPALVKTLRPLNNYRGLINNLLYLNNGVINQLTDAAFTSAEQRDCLKKIQMKTSASLPNAVKIHQRLCSLKNSLKYGMDENNTVFAELTAYIANQS